MSDQPGPPGNQPDPPEEWRVYEEDKTPDPEPPSEPPKAPPYGNAPDVPYGSTSQPAYVPVNVSSGSGAGPKIILLVVGVAVLGAVVAGAIAIFSAIGGGIGGIDAKDPDDFADFIDKVKEETGRTEVQQVGFYTDYIIVYMPYTDDPSDNRQISYTWRGGDLEEWTRGTSDQATFDLADIDPDVIEGMCDPVLAEAEGTVPDDCYVFLAKPSDGSDAWFRASASDDFSRYVEVKYDENGNEVDEGP